MLFIQGLLSFSRKSKLRTLNIHRVATEPGKSGKMAIFWKSQGKPGKAKEKC